MKLFGENKKHHSDFGGLWIDEIGAEKSLEKKRKNGEISEEDYNDLKKFWEDGYLVIKNAVPHSVIDSLLAEAESINADPYNYITRNNELGYGYATSKLRERVDFRIIDFHVNSASARDIIFSDPINHFLKLIFDRDILAFQTLYFQYGSQQAMHQDTAYVVSSSPIELAASWVALEDVKEGSGELQYFRGSHRLPDFKFSDQYKSWQAGRDGTDSHKNFLKQLHTESEARGYEQESFLPKKGDALIWSADLAHGGAKLTREGQTRKSLVTHYCPTDVDPNYFSFTDLTTKTEHKPNCFYSSRHYNLSDDTPVKSPVFLGNRKKINTVSGQTFDIIPVKETGVQMNGRKATLIPKGDAFGVFVEQIGGFASTSVEVELQIEVQADSVLTLNYTAEGEPGRDLSHDVSHNLQSGINEISILIPSTDRDELFRLNIEPADASVIIHALTTIAH